MTDDVRNLIRFVVDGDIRNAQTQCRIMLEKNVPEKDARFKENELRKLNLLKPELIQLPANLENLLIAEDATNFPESRFLLREEEETVINKLLATRKAALAIKELGIHYTCSLLLTGLPGVGKTELARYIAHKANLPFVFLKFLALSILLLAGHSRTSAECSITQSARLVFFVLMKLMPSECAVAAAMMSLK